VPKKKIVLKHLFLVDKDLNPSTKISIALNNIKITPRIEKRY
jgi:hypothetical protein